MPLYYDTGAPTLNTKNSITRTAKDFGIRDFLLHRNIQNPIKYPQLSTSINGAPKGGEPVLDTMVGSGVVIQHVRIEVDGIKRYNDAILMNRFKNTTQSAPSLLSINNIATVPIFPTPANGTVNYIEEDLDKYGILAKNNAKDFRKLNTIKNLYLDATKQIDMADFVSIQPILTTQQLPSYLDEYGRLNLGGNDAIQAVNVIGSIFNGQGIGLAKGGISTNFDIRGSLAGRVLTATGLMNDSKLGVIGGQQLALALANNAAFNTQQYILGKLNVSDNILSLVKTGNLQGFRPDYKITVPNTNGGKVLDIAERILGFNVPKSYLENGGSIFASENGNITNIERANNMLLNTGNGQIKSLLFNVLANVQGTNSTNDSPNSDYSPFRSGYVPGYTNHKREKLIDSQGYAYMDGEGNVYSFINSITKNNVIPDTKEIGDYGFIGTENNFYRVKFGQNGETSAYRTNYSWTSNKNGLNIVSDEYQFDGTNISQQFDENTIKKTLLSKTQKLFNSKNMKNIFSVKGDMKVQYPTQIQSAVAPNGGISKGSGVLSAGYYDANGRILSTSAGTADSTFCRAWTPYDRYDTVYKLIRNSGLNESENSSAIFDNSWRLRYAGSVLDTNGFVKIAPYKTDDLSRQASEPKKYMFSIENLAWVGTPAANLLPYEQGPGDLLSGKFGKIMWFPPYGIEFSESSNVNIESTNFIGRGEPIYTYNNTERTGQLSFKVIIDHPSIANAFAGSDGPDDEFVRSWFAGCVDLDSKWANRLTEEEKMVVKTVTVIKTRTKTILPKDPIPPFKIYFKNDCVDVDTTYEANPSGSAGIAPYQSIVLDYKKQPNGTCIKQKNQKTWPDDKSFGLNLNSNVTFGSYNNSWISETFGDELKTFFNSPDFVNYKIVITATGYASKQGCYEQNLILSKQRAENVKTWLEGKLKGVNNNVTFKAVGGGEIGPPLTNAVKEWEQTPKQNRFAIIKFEYSLINNVVDDEPEITERAAQISLNQQIKKRFYTEKDFFERIQNDDPFIYDQFRQKIRYFHPSFHSTTPEGFNSRLTFLLQCTRQGPTIGTAGPRNLAFGPAPVCILRIGDFYNTKIIMDTVNFDFEPLVWDLNPEGVGVQPMIANVSISFKYIGGSSLYGPINKLQNALSFNYFANTQVYDPRADWMGKTNTPRENQPDTNKDAAPEMEYSLGTTIDPSVSSLGNLDPYDVNKKVAAVDINAKNPNQVIGNDKATNNITSTTNNTEDIINYADFSFIGKHNFIFREEPTPTLETAKGTLVLNISATNLTRNHKFNVTIYDANNNIKDIGVGTLNKSNAVQTFTYKIDLDSDNFVFGTLSPYTLNQYNVKLRIIGIKTINSRINL